MKSNSDGCEYCGKPTFYEDMGGQGSFVWIHSNEKDAKVCIGPPPVGDGFDAPSTLRRWKMTKAEAEKAREKNWSLAKYQKHKTAKEAIRNG